MLRTLHLLELGGIVSSLIVDGHRISKSTNVRRLSSGNQALCASSEQARWQDIIIGMAARSCVNCMFALSPAVICTFIGEKGSGSALESDRALLPNVLPQCVSKVATDVLFMVAKWPN